MSITIGGGLYSVLRRAGQEAVRLKKLSIGSDDLLFGLLGRYPPLRAAIPVRPQPEETGEPPHPSPVDPELSVELTVELTRAMREAYWRAFGWPGPARDRFAGTPGWEPEAAAVLRVAAHLAVRRRAPSVGSNHLLEALLETPGSRAGQHIAQAGLLPGRLDDVAARIWPRGDREPPRSGLAGPLRRIGVLAGPDPVPAGRLTARLVASASRLLTQTTPALGWLELEAVAETVRLGHDRTAPAHLIMAVLVLEEETRAGELRPAAPSGAANEILLSRFGLARQEVGLVVAGKGHGGEFAGPQPRRAWRTDRNNPPWTAAAARIAERARELSTLGGRVPAGAAHLVYAALTDPDDSAPRLLGELGADPSAIRGLAAHRLGVA
ncbi:Clp protease N-terminal domain-containing protein [Micromonospora echinaurantiaca]|uniref:Clp protease N-terminal domain-containing protein n=1 Tax=Micromonospora TaxID=1873 RepID=UPI000D6F6E30|nr:Clp protease N-terminal domain-containing protein [Micromonospora sp. S4605]PWU53803.1 hypothetical protein DLJ47_15325 [Micromonospora sp. S4605]